MASEDSLAIVGTGATSVNVLANYILQTRSLEYLAASLGINLPHKTLYLIDREGNHGGGKAWGIHADPSMLFSHPSGGIPDGFSDWLRANENAWRPAVEAHRNGALATWFSINQKNLDKKNYDAIAMPRFVYGMFRKEQFLNTLSQLPANIEVRILNGTVSELDKTGDGKPVFRFNDDIMEEPVIRDANGRVAISSAEIPWHSKELVADVGLIATGFSDPPAFEQVSSHPRYFANTLTRHPAIKGDNFAEQFRNTVLDRYAQTGQPVRLAILGTSATFVDVANMIYNDPELSAAVDITTVSSSGMLTKKVSEHLIAESREALDGLQRSGKLHYEKGRIGDVIPSQNGGIGVKFEDGSVQEFDVAVQALGARGIDKMPMIETGKKNGVLTANASSPSGIAIGGDFSIGSNLYIYGVLAEKELREKVGAINPGRPELSSGFLTNAFCETPCVAGTLVKRMFNDSLAASAILPRTLDLLSKPIDPVSLLAASSERMADMQQPLASRPAQVVGKLEPFDLSDPVQNQVYFDRVNSTLAHILNPPGMTLAHSKRLVLNRSLEQSSPQRT